MKFSTDFAFFFHRQLLGLVALIACFTGPGLHAQGFGTSDRVTKMYLDIKGIAGDVTDPGFEGQIEILYYSWDGTNGGVGEMSLTKHIDSSSPALFLFATTGDYIKAATLSVVQTLNGAFAGSMKIDLANVLITSVGSVGENESMVLSFQRSKVTSKNGGIVATDPITHLYLDIKGVAGDVTDPGFEGQIEVVAYGWTETSGPGEMTLLKYIDSSSPSLLSIAASGSVLKSATLEVVQTIGGEIFSSMTIDIRDVLITNVVTGAETESITLRFQRSKVTQ